MSASIRCWPIRRSLRTVGTVSIDVCAFRYASGGDWPKPARGAPVSPGAVDDVAVVAAHPFDQPPTPDDQCNLSKTPP